MLKAYKYRIYPNSEQRIQIAQVKCMLFSLDEIHCAQKVLQIVT